MVFFLFEMDFFQVFNISLGYNTSFTKQGLKSYFCCWEISSKLLVSLMRLVQRRKIKSKIAEKCEFRNPGFKTWVSKFVFEKNIENPRLDKLNFWFTLIGPVEYIDLHYDHSLYCSRCNISNLNLRDKYFCNYVPIPHLVILLKYCCLFCSQNFFHMNLDKVCPLYNNCLHNVQELNSLKIAYNN